MNDTRTDHIAAARRALTEPPPLVRDTRTRSRRTSTATLEALARARAALHRTDTDEGTDDDR